MSFDDFSALEYKMILGNINDIKIKF
jgi:hypothetical protein